MIRSSDGRVVLTHDTEPEWDAADEADDGRYEGGGPVVFFDAIEGAFGEIEEDFRYSGGGRRAADLARLPYHEYLCTPHWRHTRRRALQRAGYQCKRCEARGRRLDVHHLTYDRLGRERESDLMVLCASCHVLEHLRWNGASPG